MSHATPTPLTSSLLDPSDPEAVREVLDLKALVFHAPRVSEDRLEPDQAMLAQNGFRTTVVRDSSVSEPPAVASFLSVDSALSVPGGADVPTAAITDVVVMPTYKRRGILRRWMTAELTRARESGQTCAALHSAEPGIYGRFGFGLSAARSTWTVHPTRTQLHGEAVGSMRMVTADEAARLFRQVELGSRVSHAGTLAVSPLFWPRHTGVATGEERSRWFAAHTDAEGTVDGVVSYSFPGGWSMGRHENRMVVEELRATTPEAERELWRHCAGTDFVTEITYSLGTPDLPLPWYFTNPRAAESGPIWDGLWTRILDVPAALTARRYPVPGEVTLTVTDPLELTEGTFRLTCSEDGEATCTPITEPDDYAESEGPHLTLGVDALASLWMGGGAGVPKLADLLLRGDASLTDPADLESVSALFGWPVAPHGLTDF